MSKLVLALIAGAAVLASLSPAAAYTQCLQCYRKQVLPAQYRTVYQTVMVAPQRLIAHRLPARYGVVQEAVMVSPPQKAWQVTRDAYGRETLCLVKLPARYGVASRAVMLEPERVVAQAIPAQYATVARTEMVAPPQAAWVPVGADYPD